MNKKLVALAVAGALALPLAAQAQTANVTLYGSLRLGVANVRATNSTAGVASVAVTRVDSNSSRFGLKGEEDLGGGLKAIFLIESGFDASSNGNNSVNNGAGAASAGNTIASRDTYVGLTGGFGTVRLGQFDTPYKNIDALTARFLDTGIQAETSLQSNCSGPGSSFSSTACFDRRQVNSARYDTPNFSGLTVGAQWAAEQEAPASGGVRATVWSGNVLYQNGPLKVGAAYERHEDFRGSELDDTGGKVAVNYTFGPGNIGAVYERLKYETPDGDLTRNYWMVTGAWTLGSAQIIGSFGKANVGKGGTCNVAGTVCTTVGNISSLSNSGAKQWTLGATYDMSKRTQLFGYYTRIDNETNADYRFSINSYATGGKGADPSGLEVGIVHHF